ncbi:hypothetical protein C8J57DRAFT_1334545 [Mycena rebaudengoi]|nr:hypothetical protein C8J57DRAFT_1334545 [Mycena rebaudengoi]
MVVLTSLIVLARSARLTRHNRADSMSVYRDETKICANSILAVVWSPSRRVRLANIRSTARLRKACDPLCIPLMCNWQVSRR